MGEGKPVHIIVMGVSGSGKTTLGRLIAARLGAEFIESDRLHAPENVERMRAGIPLTDADRWPWLDRVAAAALAAPGRAVVACSALKKIYRDRLRDRLGEVVFVQPHGDPAVIHERMAVRKDHFMPASLLASQIATLEDATGEKLTFQVPIVGDPEAIVADLLDDPAFRRALGEGVAA